MKATINHINELSPVVKNLWLEHPLDGLKEMWNISGDESAVLTYVLDNKFVGVTLVCIRHDYVDI